MASATDCMAFERYSRLLLRRTGPYQLLSFGPEYAKINQDRIRDSVSINRLTRVAKEERPNVYVTSYSRTNTDSSPVKEPSIKNKKNACATKNIVGHEERPTRTYYTAR